MTYEGFRLKTLKFVRVKFAEHRKKQLLGTDFTIISNNCWGGMVYESYNLIKSSPTIGLFFMATDYIKFISNLPHYLSSELTFIKPEKSKNVDYLQTIKNFGVFPIAKLDDIEIVFLHYKTEDDARDKWARRCQRINYEKLIIKFNDQNGCTEKELQDFINLPYKNKIFFTSRRWNLFSPIIKKIWQPPFYDAITASHEPFGRKITKFINELYKNDTEL